MPGADTTDPVVLPRPGVVRIVGPGRAGGALARALAGAGWTVAPPVRHGDDPATATDGVELVVVATPDAAIADVAAAVAPRDGVVVAHLSGSLGTGVLAPHAHRVALHPLASLPDAEVGAERLQGAWFAVTASTARASAVAGAVVDALGGRLLAVADEDRVAHHAAASIAANHLVALLAQVERIAPDGVPLHAYLDMVRATVDNVARLGPAAALTGPAARGDTATIERHLAAIPADERPAYLALSARAARLAADAREASGG